MYHIPTMAILSYASTISHMAILSYASTIPNMAVLSYASTASQNHVANHFGTAKFSISRFEGPFEVHTHEYFRARNFYVGQPTRRM